MTTPALYSSLATWFEAHRRPLPWRSADTTPWGVLVSEIMAQQTPVSRVVEPWKRWMELWPEPGALAQADSADVLREWGNLGYPRRALRLQECARAIVEHHGGRVPESEKQLLALPGIGTYTAAAVSAFAFGHRSVVLDTNIRRVIGRVCDGVAAPPLHLTKAQTERARSLVPDDPAESVVWNEGIMELGALVCTAQSPACDSCPFKSACAWKAAGFPNQGQRVARPQGFEGTDRQVRDRIMKELRTTSPASLATLLVVAAVPTERFERVLGTLVTDGLLHTTDADEIGLGPAPHGSGSSSAGS